MSKELSKELFILGVTSTGKVFRPSDWSERLAGVMSSFRAGIADLQTHLSYSPWCVPTTIGSCKCVVVSRELYDFDAMAWDFCVNFARDNDLQIFKHRPTTEDVYNIMAVATAKKQTDTHPQSISQSDTSNQKS